MSDTGVTFPRGFQASGVACGLKKNGQPDLALVVCPGGATAAGIFTRNVVKGHSLAVCRRHVARGAARAVLINAGNANACVGPRGESDALALCALVAEKVGCAPEEVLPGSTGVIGIPLPMDRLRSGVGAAFALLSEDGGEAAARAIMTTDTRMKQAYARIEPDGREVRIGGMAKGSGMIHPDMATMIAIITTDAQVPAAALDAALRQAAAQSFNRISVDGDTSVCDKALLIASGASGVSIAPGGPAWDMFTAALHSVCRSLARMLAADGEGATKLLTIEVKNAPTARDAHCIAAAVSKSPLCKTAAFGRDANWGRVLTAAGYSGATFDSEKVDIFIGGLPVCRNGAGLPFDEKEALRILAADEVTYTIDLKQGDCDDFMWTCDLSYDYVKINGSYRS